MDYNIGIGEYMISRRRGDRLITHALGSCVAVTFYLKDKNIGGMIHIALPKAKEAIVDVKKRSYYADVGLPLMINELKSKYGCNLNELDIRMFGGADSINPKDQFRIGEKNLLVVEAILKDYALKFDKTETGGVKSRTIEMDLQTGVIKIRKQSIVI